MSTISIETFFTSKMLVIPSYQRDYAWTERNVDDLFSDVEEALEVGGGHYLGTFILCQRDPYEPAQVVDGQQRLTTLTMLLHALVEAVDADTIKQHYRNVFIHHPVHGPKFQVLGDNQTFFVRMLAGDPPAPETDGQERLLAAFRWIKQRVLALKKAGGQEIIQKWLTCISRMEVLQFIQPDEGRAIRMFQSVNDRGVPLSRMDIVKSLLVYYSNRYLDGALDHHIAEQFGKAFRSFSRIKRLGAQQGYKIRNIDRDLFREDDVLRYHYLAFDPTALNVAPGGDYSATADTVLHTFLKPALTSLRQDQDRLRAFIQAYTDDLINFFAGLEQLAQQSHEDMQAYMLWVTQDLSATLYPLVIRLHLKGWLTALCPNDGRTVQELISVVDLRVFKLRGTNPQADIFRITRALSGGQGGDSMTLEALCQELRQFCERFMPDALMRTRLQDEDMYRHPALPRILLEVEQQQRSQTDEQALDLPALAARVAQGLTVEHVFPQDPNNAFAVTTYGFEDMLDYDRLKHRLGNLIWLEGAINSACNNQTIEAKVTAPALYMASEMCAVRALAAECAHRGGRYNREALNAKTLAIADRVLQRWPVST